MELLVVIAIGWFFCGVIAELIMGKNGHFVGCFLGFLLGPLGILIAAVLSLRQPSTTTNPNTAMTPQDRRPCPYCAEMIMRNAKVCRFCDREVEPLQVQASTTNPISTGLLSCPNCGTLDVASAKRCAKCGISFVAQVDERIVAPVFIESGNFVQCQVCGASNNTNLNRCAKCGTRFY